jgi:hypothetical protein
MQIKFPLARSYLIIIKSYYAGIQKEVAAAIKKLLKVHIEKRQYKKALGPCDYKNKSD